MKNGEDLNRRRAARQFFLADVDLDVAANDIEAMTVDISETGVRLDMWKPLQVRMRFVADGKLVDRKAQLVWGRQTPDGCVSYGFEYIQEKKRTQRRKAPLLVKRGKKTAASK